ncbi:hypothetical protein [Botrimarina sp.]|uniref:hypothetical protein n=1 Tax=Botrimarina sp. TaxID=2795802 RepID=UPI0032EAD70B
MPAQINADRFREDRQGKSFADLLDEPDHPLRDLMDFFNDGDRRRRMQESEVHHNRAPLAGVVRELESQESVRRILAGSDAAAAQRLRQAVGILTRMVMEDLGWQRTGRQGTLGVRAESEEPAPIHNQRGLSMWFARGERFRRSGAPDYPSVPRRARRLAPPQTGG